MRKRLYKPADFHCRQCGKCCKRLNLGKIFKPDDVKRWRKQKRDDILVNTIVMEYEGEIEIVDFFDSKNNRYVITYCPFVVRRQGKYWCKIHETKPWVCEHWPFTPKNALNPDNPLIIDAAHFHEDFPFCRAFDRK